MSKQKLPLLVVEDDEGLQKQLRWCFDDYEVLFAADRDSAELLLTGPPPGIVSVGGYRFRDDQLQQLASQFGGDTVLAALPDAIAGHRLAGTAADRVATRQALDALGLNPLIGGAFTERRRAAAGKWAGSTVP